MINEKITDTATKILIIMIILTMLCFLGFIIYLFGFANLDEETMGVQEPVYSTNIAYEENVAVLSNNKETIDLISSNSNNNSEILEGSSTRIKYYYDQLDNNAKTIYDALENNKDNFKKGNYTINLSTKFDSLLHQSEGERVLTDACQSAWDAFTYDNPEIFYIELSKISLITEYTTVGNKTTYSVSIGPGDNANYFQKGFTSQTQVEEAMSQIENVKNNIIQTVSGSDYDKILKVHDTLADMIEYDTTLNRTNTHNIYGALIEKQCVCEGYAKALKYILDDLNIPCILVSGTATNTSGITESHMWNYVKLDGNWYGVDMTWDDPIIVGGSITNNIRHTYLCKGSNVFNKTHQINGQISQNGIVFVYPDLNTGDYK